MSLFSAPEYRKAEFLAWKSEKLLEFGDRENAKLHAEQAIDCAKDKSWLKWYDGAQKKVAYGALMRIDKQESLFRARECFGKDLAQGKINFPTLLSDVIELFEFLEIDDELADDLRREDSSAFAKHAKASTSFRPFSRHAMDYATKGITTLEEVVRVTGMAEEELDEFFFEFVLSDRLIYQEQFKFKLHLVI